MRTYYTTCFFILVWAQYALSATAIIDDARDEKLISTFQIVRFPNDACVGSNSRNGTCYTSAECSDKSGTSSGSCADGFGVCCTFLIQTCGSSSGENITYWKNPTTTSYGVCGLTINPVSDDICSLRLDFTTFAITGPSTQSIAHQTRRLFGQPVGDILDTTYVLSGSSFATLCMLDQFRVQGASPSSNPPVMCGELLTNTHIYVEADVDRGNRLQFTFADAADASMTSLTAKGVNTLISSRTWDITATQIECSSATLPPVGCTQWFWGSGVAVLNSFNWKSTTVATTNMHLGSQHQRMCIRRERGYCIGCYATAAIEFDISGLGDGSLHYTYVGGCCGYATGGANAANGVGLVGGEINQVDDMGVGGAAITQAGFDCIIIPGAFGPANEAGTLGKYAAADFTATNIAQTLINAQSANLFPTPLPPHICGSAGGIGVGAPLLTEAAFEGDGIGTDDDNHVEGSSINLTICTRNNPFVVEFMSDDLDGLGFTSADAEVSSATQAHNQGFVLYHKQIAC